MVGRGWQAARAVPPHAPILPYRHLASVSRAGEASCQEVSCGGWILSSTAAFTRQGMDVSNLVVGPAPCPCDVMR